MSEENKRNNEKTDQTDWKLKFNDLLTTCQSELKKTTQIGMKMVTASQSNAQLHDTYEALGRMLKEGIENNTIKVENSDIEALVAKANKLETDLEFLESEVQTIKKG
jgi:outer membrane lipopolysaccharide assembly protein LptE/RlpB